MDSKERRTSHRRHIRLPILYWRMENEKVLPGGYENTSKDLSANGLSFESKVIQPVGSLLLAQIHLPGRPAPILAKLRVIRIESSVGTDKYLTGAHFVDLPQEEKAFISNSVDRLNIYSWLDRAVQSGASDIHLTVGRPPVIRAQGRIQFLSGDKIEEGQIRAMLFPLLNDRQIQSFEDNKELDFAFSPSVNARFRCNMHLQRGFLEATLRCVPSHTKSFENLGLPAATMDALCKQKSGLLLISGTTGSGKTTTMASMVAHMNEFLERVIITVEDPIEYVHSSHKSVVKQRELGNDTVSYSEALKRSLRQDPDVICVGELLDKDIVVAAMRAAETGHLVISTIHAPDSIQTLERIVNLFPPEQGPSICQQLSSCLTAVVHQALLPGKEAGTRVLGTEVLISTPAIKNMIREGKFFQIRTSIQTGKAIGMHTLASRVKELYDSALIDFDVMQMFSKGDQ